MTEIEFVENPTGQTTFVAAPRVVIEFDPKKLAYGKPNDDGWTLENDWSYESEWGLQWGCYVAWPLEFPCVFGQGSSQHWALVDLAQELRTRCWPQHSSLTPATQLAEAATRLEQRDLVLYLKRLARPAQLSSEYGLVLR